MRLLGDTIIVIHLPELPNTTLFIPETVDQNATRVTKAVVIRVGEKFRFKEHVLPGDTVFVPAHLGTRLPKKDYSNFNDGHILYDGEDVLAVEPWIAFSHKASDS